MTDPRVSDPPPALPRRRVLWWLGGGAAAMTVAGLGAAQFVRSPAQRIADTAPPPQTMLTAPVELRVLQDTVVLRGLVAASTTVDVQPAPAAEAGRAVVTAVRLAAGDRFTAGEVLIEVSGRPVVALAGGIPAYRDLRPGTRGRDVSQLQSALRTLDHLTGRPDGEFGQATKQAVAAFYQDLGYETPVAGDPAALAVAEDTVRQAARTLAVSEDELARLIEDPPTLAPGEPDPVVQAEQQVKFAKDDLAAAETARDEVERTTGAMLPLSEVVFLPEFPSRVERSTARLGLDLAEGELEGPLLTVSSGALVVRARLNPGQRELLAEGMPVEILYELTGTTTTGQIASIGELAPDETDRRSHPMEVHATDGPLDEQLAGADVRLTVTAATTDGQVLVVPLSAVFARADGQVAVLRIDPDGSEQLIPVVPGVSGDGHVAVTPAGGGLAAGDQVVVGADESAP